MIHITSPTIAGTRTDVPDLPPKTILQLIFANAIKIITAIPKINFVSRMLWQERREIQVSRVLLSP
jgi:hypothetical protein